MLEVLFPMSNWRLKVTAIANRRMRFELYWGDNLIPTHVAECSIDDFNKMNSDEPPWDK